jgi:hypothetical protein
MLIEPHPPVNFFIRSLKRTLKGLIRPPEGPGPFAFKHDVKDMGKELDNEKSED